MPEVHRIWGPATGITDLPSDWSATLTVPAMRDVEREWAERRGEFEQGGRSADFAERLYREWAIETGAIEGLYDIERGVTESLIEQGFHEALLEHGSVNRDPATVLAMLGDHRGVLDMLFDFVGQTRSLTVGYVKEVHAALCRSQETIEVFDESGRKFEVPFLKGTYKQRPNHPRRGDEVYEYCPVEHVDAEMARLVQLHESQRLAGVPIETQAAWLHHRFTQVHPFQDGNGRVARALASLVFIRAGLLPLTVPLAERDSYLDVLERADAGRLRPLVLYVSRRQQAALRKAMHLAAKQTPEPNVFS